MTDEVLDKFVRCFGEDGFAQPCDGELVVHQVTEDAALDAIYSKLPNKYPRLFEKLLLSYRWHRADVGQMRLLANPPGTGLTGFMQELQADKVLYEVCMRNGYMQFGTGPLSYDPVCFYVGKGAKECTVVQLDHEQILCNARIKFVAKVAKSFDALVRSVIAGTLDTA